MTDESRARLAVSAAARELSDFARAFVPISPGMVARAASNPDVVLANDIEEATRLVAYAEDVRTSMVAYAAVCGASWEVIGDGLATSRQYAHKKYSEIVRTFQEGVAAPDAATEQAHVFQSQYPAAHRPEYWAAQLDEWVELHRERTDGGPSAPAVSGGLARLGPLAELFRLDGQRADLLNEYVVPPPEKVLPLAERRLQLLHQLAEAGHDLAEDIPRLQRQITELRAAVPASAAGSPERTA